MKKNSLIIMNIISWFYFSIFGAVSYSLVGIYGLLAPFLSIVVGSILGLILTKQYGGKKNV